MIQQHVQLTQGACGCLQVYSVLLCRCFAGSDFDIGVDGWDDMSLEEQRKVTQACSKFIVDCYDILCHIVLTFHDVEKQDVMDALSK